MGKDSNKAFYTTNILKTYFPRHRMHSSGFSGSIYFLLITQCHKHSVERTLHIPLVVMSLENKGKMFKPQPPYFLGFDKVCHLTREMPLWFLFLAHGYLKQSFLPLFCIHLGMYANNIQNTRMTLITLLRRVTMPPMKIHMLHHKFILFFVFSQSHSQCL